MRTKGIDTGAIALTPVEIERAERVVEEAVAGLAALGDGGRPDLASSVALLKRLAALGPSVADGAGVAASARSIGDAVPHVADPAQVAVGQAERGAFRRWATAVAARMGVVDDTTEPTCVARLISRRVERANKRLTAAVDVGRRRPPEHTRKRDLRYWQNDHEYAWRRAAYAFEALREVLDAHGEVLHDDAVSEDDRSTEAMRRFERTWTTIASTTIADTPCPTEAQLAAEDIVRHVRTLAAKAEP